MGIEMQVGDVIRTKAITHHDGQMQIGYKATTGHAMAFLFLGGVAHGAEFSPEKVLNDLGWFLKDSHS